MSESIYSAIPSRSRRSFAGRPTASVHTNTTIASSHDAALVAILDAPLHEGEPAQLGFFRKEAELRAAFAALPVLAARALHARLANPRTNDVLATKFARLVAERRNRLLAFLADARRREAIARSATSSR